MLRTSALFCLGVAALAAVAQPPPTKNDSGAPSLPPFLSEFQGSGAGKPYKLPAFLEYFLRGDRELPVDVGPVKFAGALGRVDATRARIRGFKPLPAVIVVYDDDAWTPWMTENTVHIASIGYQAVTINLRRRREAANPSPFVDEAALSDLLAAVRWLRTRRDVVQNQIGVIGWGWSGGQALALAAATPVQACIVCDATLPKKTEVALLDGLRRTPLLAVTGGATEPTPGMRDRFKLASTACKWHIAKGQQSGFMGPPDSKAYNHDAAEDAWVAIYNFLEKHVEDARPAEVAAKPARQIATIADIMRSVNEPAGLRGTLSKVLEQPPQSKREWQRIRANAALVAESGSWLETRQPPKGPLAHWQKEAQAFTDAALALVDAADRRDYAAAKAGLTRLAGQCAACHQEHR